MNLKSQAILYESPRNSLHISRCFCPPLAGQGVVTLSLSKGCPAERLGTVPYNRHYMLAM
jgi:hypothetical protein